MRNDRKRSERTGNDMKEDFCLSMCVYSLIKVSLLVLVTNCFYENICHPSPSPSKHGNTKKNKNQAQEDAFIYNIWEKSIGKLKIYGALNVFNLKNNGQNYSFSFLMSKLSTLLDTLKIE